MVSIDFVSDIANNEIIRLCRIRRRRRSVSIIIIRRRRRRRKKKKKKKCKYKKKKKKKKEKKKKKKGNKTPNSGPYTNFRRGMRITGILQGGCEAPENIDL